MLENLRKRVVYFGSPKNFNDLYDCAVIPSVRPVSESMFSALHSIYSSKDDIPISARQEIEAMSPTQLANTLRSSVCGAVRDQIDDFRGRRGVACFSEERDNLLMWAHYANKYKGLCLEFDTRFEPFSGARRVKYTNEKAEVSADRILIDKDYSEVIELFHRKSESWSYEKEWRAMHVAAGTSFGYFKEALTGVYFGPSVSDDDFRLVWEILRDFGKGVRVFRGMLCDRSYRILFSEVLVPPA